MAKRSRLPYVLLLGLAPACSNSGGCSSCGGVTPLPGGFINEERIENAAAVRITESGFDFLEANLGLIAGNLIGGDGGAVEFEVPESQGSFSVLITDIDYTICPGGPDAAANPPKCVAEIDIANANLSLQPEGPHNITITGDVPLRLQYLPFDSDIGGMEIVLNNNDACPGENQEFAPIGATIRVSIETDDDPTHARQGYSRVRIEEVTISQSDIENAIKLNCSGFLGTIADLLKGVLVGQLFGGLQDTLVGAVEEQLCQPINPDVMPMCPTGTNPVGDYCRYGTDESSECVSIVLGMDGHANLGGLLSGISPGTKGGMNFLLAAGGGSVRDDGSGFTWGDLNPANNGATLGMFGGVEPDPISSCVPLSTLQRPAGLTIPTELIDDSLITNWPAATPGPHLGIGLSESFFNYALSGMYNSGLLCIGFSTETIDLLNSGTLGLLAQSLKDLGLQREVQPIAIVLKPTQPPKVTFGNGTNLTTDPLIRLQLQQAGFDFYMFSSDRYIRFMTATFDIDAPMNLTVTPDGLVPVLDELAITNGVVDNAQLLKEDPASIAASLQGLLSSQIGGLIGGGLPAVDLNDLTASLGMRLVIPESVEGSGSPGLRTVTKDGERFLGIFAALEVTPAMMQNAMETSSSVEEVDIDDGGLARAHEHADKTITPRNAPEVVILAGVEDDHGLEVEHQVRVDGGIWKPWTKDRYLHISDNALRLQGKHQIEVRSRAVGQAYTLDQTPDVHEIIVDRVAPAVKVSPVDESGRTTIDIYEFVSGENTLVRYRFDDDTFSEWTPSGALNSLLVPEDAEEIEVEVKDEGGNVGTARQQLIRGLPRDAGDGGCGCVLAGAPDDGTPKWPLALLALGLLKRRRSGKPSPEKKRARSLGGLLSQSRTMQATGAVLVMGIGGSFSGCSCDEETTPIDNYKCEDPCIDLEPGLIGSYTGAAVASDGTLWVSGYLEANYEQAFPSYGDLVVGRLEGDKVAWEIVDGVPFEPAPDGAVANLKGFRGGQTEPGDDVGLWTSLALDPSSNLPAVAYYDRTNKALKFARFNGTAWEISVVQDEPVADVGKYAKLAFDGGTPVIAYMALEPSSSGFLTSRVKLAREAGEGWNFEDVAVNESTPCRAGLCEGGSQCVADVGECAGTGSGCGTCGEGESCVALSTGDACAALLTVAKVEPYPLSTGLYISLATLPSGGVGVAYYDRVAGTLNVAAKEADGWVSVVVDGGTLPDGTISDVGVGSSLFISDDGTWHLAYVDGYAEALKYASVTGGAVDGTEVVDDGLAVNGVQNADGQHVIGDDANISVSPQGEVQISYQDATSGQLRFATGTPLGAGHDWEVKVLEADGFQGFFSRLVEIDGALRIVNWGRQIITTGDGVKKGVGDVTVVAP